MENWPVRKKKKRYRGLILALLMLVPAGYIGVQMVQVLRTNYQTQTAVAYSMSDVVRCDGMLAMDETVIPYEGAGVLGYQVNNGERVSAGTQVARLFADEASAQNRTLSEKLTEELSVLEKSQAGAAADVEALMNQNQQGIYSALDLLESGKIDYVFSTSSKGRTPERDGVRIRRKAVEHQIPCLTAIDTIDMLSRCLISGKKIEDISVVDITKI